MADADRVTVYQMSDRVEHREIAFAATGVARLYAEVFRAARGEQSTTRLLIDAAVDDAALARVVDAVRRDVLPGLPRGVCIVYRGALAMTFDYRGKP